MIKLETELFSRTLSKEYQALNIIISTGRSKELLGRNVPIKELDEMTDEQMAAYYKIYELNYADKVSSSLSGIIISAYSYVINKVIPIDNVEKLQVDLNNSYLLSNELKNATGGLARIGGKVWALVELGLTTVKHIKIKTFVNEDGQGQTLCKTYDDKVKEDGQEQELCKEL